MPRRSVDLLTRTNFRFGLGIPVAAAPEGQDLVQGKPRDFGREMDRDARLATTASAARLFDIARQVLGAACTGLLRDRCDVEALFEGSPTVVTLVAHSPNAEEVELLEERVRFADLANAVPADFDGLLELRICHAEACIADWIRRARPCCVVRAPDGILDLPAVAWSYARTLRLVTIDRISYDDAARRAHADLVKLSSRKEA